MSKRFTHMPAALLRQTRFERLASGAIPALLAHPDWSAPTPVVIWLHGRTVNKELDPGRYLRWIRAGVATCAIDLPGHGERFEKRLQSPEHTLEVVEHAVNEIDRIVEELASPRYKGVFDLDRVALGGMSAGGMATLRRLGDEHPFRAAAVESTAGDFAFMDYLKRHPREMVDRLNPARRIESWRPIPLLALHSELDEWVPVEAIRSFVAKLKNHYQSNGADASMVQLHTWDRTGAPAEHAGFGKVANEAKNLQVEFLARRLGVESGAAAPRG